LHLIEQHILGLKVAVYNVHFMQVFQRQNEFRSIKSRSLLGEHLLLGDVAGAGEKKCGLSQNACGPREHLLFVASVNPKWKTVARVQTLLHEYFPSTMLLVQKE